jgi:hypothetical protein
VEKLQKFAARLVTNDYNSSYSQLLAKLKWTPISQLATVRRGLLMHGYLHGNRHLPDEVLAPRNSQRTSARTGHDMQLAPKHHNSKTSRLNPIQVAKDIWTKLPAEAISQNLVLFKHSMKTSQMYELLSKKVEAVRRMEEAI